MVRYETPEPIDGQDTKKGWMVARRRVRRYLATMNLQDMLPFTCSA